MRQLRTESETFAIEAIRCVLSTEGGIAIDDTTITDRPDWVFEIDGNRVGAECTCITLQQLMAWEGGKRPRVLGKYYEVTFPYEPHFWVRKAIETKNAKINEYRRLGRCDVIWLVLHVEFSPVPLFACTPDLLSLMRSAAASVPSDFDSVWLVHPEMGATRLWAKGDPSCTFPELDITDSYPTLRVRQGVAILGPNGGSLSMGAEGCAESLLIQPLDTRYKL